MTAEGNRDAVQTLLAAGADVNARLEPSTPGIPWQAAVHIASRYGHSDIVSLLCNSQAPVNMPDGNGFTCLHYAAAHGHTHTVTTLLSLGARVTPSGAAGGTGHPIELARAAGHLDVVTLLQKESMQASPRATASLEGWLERLGCLELLPKFRAAGYDFDFVQLYGLKSDDLDAIGVPLNQLGLRKKLESGYLLPEKPGQGAKRPGQARSNKKQAEESADSESESDEDEDSDEESSGESTADSDSDDEDEESD